ncbi:bile acid:sodium symporter family protein [Acidovorax sp. D2M1]|uniref:Bile acid:sodium symporter family protein n=1 Tax=Acidovorax benzenivorans TaxID=2987520 RepID=A0ABT5S3E5_9BURK|nr:bile acid:sodium symporter family protein [Acidovorax benzenivorans]MDD2180482.1 bile acid:sodium symporter family protein [Acidovorax benzenivorans]
MQSDIVSTIFLPASLAFIMLSLGLGLTPADFRRIVAQPRALLVGVGCHFVLLPLVCYLMVQTFGITGAFAVGFMIVASCPTGATSNILTYIARGDVALAVSFTAVASVLTIFTLPFIVAWSLGHFMGTQQTVEVPVRMMMGQVFMMLALPVGVGMLLRHLWPAATQRREPVATRIATVLFLIILVLAIIKNWPLLRDNFTTLAPFALGLNLTMLAIGFIVAWLARLSRRQSVTLGIETAIQNAALALVIATTVLKQDAMAVPGVLYGVLMYVGGLLFANIMRRFTTTA